jgi:putative photosynthetic complex assembly protein
MIEAEVEEIRVPRGALIGAGLLILATFALAITARVTGADRAAPRLPAVTEAIAMRDLVFVERPGGEMTVRDGQTGQLLADYSSTEGGFVHGALRGLSRLRTTRDIPTDEPYRLAEWPGGRLTLQDRRTGMIVEVNAFGNLSVEGYRTFLPASTDLEVPQP